MTSSIADVDLACIATALFIYPVKGCAAMPVSELALDAGGGAVGDRDWAVIDEQGVLTWQGAYPRLALVHPRLDAGVLHLSAAGMADFTVSNGSGFAPCHVKIWNEHDACHIGFDAEDAGSAVAAWLTQVVGAPLRLVRLGAAARFREGSDALHLVFAASMSAVNQELVAAGHPPADVRRYRPNIVLSARTPDAAIEFIEESLDALEWPSHAGDSRLEITGPCVRCVVPNVDTTSARVDKAVLETLALLSQRRRPGAATVFGVYARSAAGARLLQGDLVQMVLAFG
jgi:uncharacterized protein YcbX